MTKRFSALPGLISFLRATLLAIAAAILCWPLAVTSGVLLAILGAFTAALAADMASRLRFGTGERRPKSYPTTHEEGSRLRIPSVLLICGLTLVLGTAVARFLVTTPILARIVGPVATRWLNDALLWFFLIAPVVFALRFLAARKNVLVVLEVIAVGGALVVSLAAHREGMVHRPLTIGDFAWSRGFDPVVILLVLGGFVTLLLAALLVSEDRRRRLPIHFSALLAVALLLLLIVNVSGLPKPEPSGLGLSGEPEENEDGEGEDTEGEGGGSSSDSSDELDDLEFKDDYSGNGKQAPVAVVLMHDDYSPPPGVYYFRQTAFSQYNGRRLVQAMSSGVDRDIVTRFPAKPVRVPEAPTISDQRMELRTTMGLLIDHVRPFALDSPAALRPVKNPNPMRFQRTFEVLSHVQILPYQEMIGLEPGDRDWSEEEWDHYTEAPPDERYHDLADQLVDMLQEDYRDDPLAQALAVKTYLDKKGIYSLKSKHAGAGDPAASFLFGDLTGYCVHFAHAAAYLLRTRGIPSRVAAGYAIAESARGSGSTLMVRGADAHAWPEIYLDDVGWVVVDLAPEQTLDEPTGPPDQRLQSMLGELMRQQFEPLDEFAEATKIDWAQVRKFFLQALIVLLAIAYGVKFYRSLVPYFARPLERYRLAYRAALDRLAEVGLRRRFGESREHFAARARPNAPSFVELTQNHLSWALGGERAHEHHFSNLMVGVERDLKQTTPAWRRVLGFLNPVSWLLAR